MCEILTAYIPAGYFVSGLREGYGKQTYSNLDCYEGRWEKDTYEGFGCSTCVRRAEVYQVAVFCSQIRLSAMLTLVNFID